MSMQREREREREDLQQQQQQQHRKKETTAKWERWILGSSKERRYINISEHYS
jgi:hypothetical protein